MKFSQMKWQKCGLVVEPDPRLWWMQTHAMVPTPQQIDGSLYRLYFAGRNEHNQSHIGYAVIDMDEPDRILDISSEPVLAPGRLGTFDDNGVLPSCVVKDGSQTRLYYIGFKPGGTTRMDLFGGLAISDDGEYFERWSEAPILERCRANPFINTAPWVVRDGDRWRIFYVAGVEWIHPDLPRYNIQTGLSRDGMSFERDGTVAIDFKPGENALARPYVVIDEGVWRMWFSAKTDCYRSCYAESSDGIHWTRYDEAMDIAPGASGPDQEMVCYNVVIEHKGRLITYYNGNGYGVNGICLAVSE